MLGVVHHGDGQVQSQKRTVYMREVGMVGVWVLQLSFSVREDIGALPGCLGMDLSYWGPASMLTLSEAALAGLRAPVCRLG